MKVFGEFEFDDIRMELRCRGIPVAVSFQCLALLRILLARPGEVIAREEIRRDLWPDSHVDFEHSLDVLISRLRLTLGDTRATARYIQTVPKRGYRFITPVNSGQGVALGVNTANVTRMLFRYALIAVLGGLLVLLIVRSRYQKFI